MPEVVLRIAGDNASAIASVREFITGLRDVRVEEGEVAKASAAAGATIAETARANVTKALEQREALRGLVSEYGMVAKAAVAGSDESITAHRLEMETAAKLAATYDAVGIAAKRAGTEAAASSARAREESGVARGFASRTFGLSAFAGGAFIAGAAAGLVVKKAADEAQRAQESQAQLENALRRTGISWHENADEIDRYLERAEKASSFDRIDLRTSLGQLVRATGDVTSAQRLLSTATDVARGRHMDLDASVRLVTRAYQGNVGSLRRVGIDVQAVTTAEDKLRAAHVKVTPEMEKQAKAIDRQATATRALAVLNDRYSGAAEAHARTLAGHEEALGNAFTDVSVAIGQAVTPALSRMFGWMAKEVEAATHSQQIHKILHDTFRVLGEIIGSLIADVKLLWTVFSDVTGFIRAHLIPVLSVAIPAAIVVIANAFRYLELSMPWVTIAVAAAIAVGEIIRHWKTIRSWFGDFWGYMKDTAHAAWEFIIQVARSAVYLMLQYATAGIRGILEVASHLPFVGDEARRALNSINDYLDHWKPDFGKVVDAFRRGGAAAGDSFATAAQQHMAQAANVAAAGGGTVTRRGGVVITAGRGGGSGLQQGLVSTGMSAVGVPYRYGGAPSLSSPTDCSGLMVAIFAKHGISLPRTSEQQFSQAPIKNAKPLAVGDLVFSEGIHPGHVGLYIGGNQVLEDPHTGDHVKVIPLSDFGWNGESARWWAKNAKRTGGGGGGGGAGAAAAPTPTISSVIAEGKPIPKAHHAASTALAALGVPPDLLNAISRAADEARNALAKGHYDAAIDFYKQERADYEKEAADLRRKLRDPHLTASQRSAIHKALTDVENHIRDIGGEITKAHDDIARAVRTQLSKEKQALQSQVSTLQSTVSSAWGSVQQGIISAFEAQTQAMIDAVGRQFFQGIQTPEEATLAAAQQADQIQSLQDAIAKATTPEERAAAQHALDMYNLEQAAAASRAKADQEYADAVREIQKQREQEEEHLSVALGKFGDSLQDGTASMTDLQPLLDKYGIRLGDISDSSFVFKSNLDSLGGSVGALDDALRDLAKLISQITGKPINLPPKGGGGGGGGGGGAGGGGGGAACFVAGTLVWTPAGRRPIEELRLGDVVYTYAFDFAAYVQSIVTAVDRHEGGDERETLTVSAGGREITGTYEHLVYDGDDWKPLGETSRLFTDDGRILLVDSVVPGRREPVYNLHVDHPDHNYVAGGFLVHNVKPAFAGGGFVGGPMIGPEDTIVARVSTGEGVLSRDEMRYLLLAATGGGRAAAPPVRTGPIFVLGTTQHEVGRALARIVTPAQNRQVGFKDY